MAITEQLRAVTEHHQSLDLGTARRLMEGLLQGEASELELAALLGALAARGETAEEIAGFALALRAAAVPLPLTAAERDLLVDTCGTGGDGSGTFNISTAAALVAAAAGAPVAKHGNRAVTSRCGSADVLEAMGIPITLSPEAAVESLRRYRFCFLLASGHHPGLRAVMPVRRALGVRTVFNVLGPLLNPAGARRQVMGVYSAAVMPAVAGAMTHLHLRRALVVHGAGGLDELSLAGISDAIEVSGSGPLAPKQIAPESVGLPAAPLHALAGGRDARENAAILQAIFSGERGPRRDAVVLNAAAVLQVAELAPDLPTGAQLAAAALDRGAVHELVRQLSSS